MPTPRTDAETEILAEIRALRGEIDVLRARLDAAEQPVSGVVGSRYERLSGDVPERIAPTKGAVGASNVSHSLSRRRLLASAGIAAAAAAGATVVGGSMSPRGAKAANGDPLTAGQTVTSTAPTTLEVTQALDDTGTIYGLGVTDGTLSAFPESGNLAGHTNSTYQDAILGYDQGDNVGVRGISDGGVGISGTGKHTGVAGISAAGIGVVGTSGEAHPEVRIVGQVGMAGLSLGSGSGVVGGTGSTRSQDAGVIGATLSANGRAAGLSGASSGFGPGLDVTSKKGRGMVSQSALAQLRLTPSGRKNHPVAGLRGDLFVDAEARLWYCKVGGQHAKWVQLA